MHCATCVTLKRDLNQECEVEAIAAVRQRQSGSDRQLEEAVLSSRKRQLSIFSKLDEHRIREHAA